MQRLILASLMLPLCIGSMSVGLLWLNSGLFFLCIVAKYYALSLMWPVALDLGILTVLRVASNYHPNANVTFA